MSFKALCTRSLCARLLACALLAAACALPAQARAPQALALPTQAAVSSAFSPSGGALALVLQAIDQAHSSIQMAAYLFTSSDVARALVQAKKRGVQVQVLVDWKGNFDEDARYARHALGILRNAGIAVRSVDVYPIFHDKYMVIDRRTVQTGSFNYTYSAAHRNAENVLVVWNAPELAAQYLADWQRNWALSQPVVLPY
ncbi:MULTISPECIES: phospholipase D family protein [unclassified Thiomonas]|uniref:phospholipase D family nuclease n=1 Tax=unclassified Thiomonas TaxID=2625466 RepID=UPI0004DBAE59|nr:MULTISPECIES: phospholipase D family protein [unclassified Thiomonas]MDD4999803.1 phospholipase D family protein [Thiomonas arsenitoxydans]CQR43287.1 putative Phospholipase D [Thiomonas sp. CB3]CDW93939.1 putative Phospholipase D [Thiomonas sp. CB2]VDY04689.1 putative Phospholipase D [Thiomonas sp. Bio17B3]VDY08138.1 putative Phospholipase D [Thiomonas sp. Sup16B3]